jgi:probable HAF family extracellular repeat protein
VGHAFQWQEGVLTDLGTLPGANNSGISGLNAQGVVVGISENGSIDSVIGFPEFNAVVWKNGQIINLGTFGGTFSQANAVNDRWPSSGICLKHHASIGCDVDLPIPTQVRAFIWQDGAMKDLGTLGGPDSCALSINQHGQIGWILFH